MAKDLKSIRVFSEKLNGAIEIFPTKQNPFSNVKLAWSDSGWSNDKYNWLNNGWNNDKYSWMNNGWNNDKYSWTNSGWNNDKYGWKNNGWNNSGSSGGCCITDATVNYMGLKDDCDELETLRKYRDLLVEDDPEFREVVLEYYRTAPIIVQKINKSQNKNVRLDSIFKDLVTPVIGLLKENKIDEAKALYIERYNALKKEYIPSTKKISNKKCD